MPHGDVETFHQDGSWWNRVQDTDDKDGPFDTKAEAEASGRRWAEELKSEHIVKNEDGQIGEKHSHGNDPTDVPG